jgi:histidine phosphotransferase ChpT
MFPKADLAALVASRICHDLISPIGAIGNGVELLQMDTAAGNPEMSLISQSVDQANARIRFFRVAFGPATPDQRMARAEVQGILSDLAASTRVKHEWLGPTDLFRRDVRLGLLMILCLESALPYGGTIRFDVLGNKNVLTGKSPKIRIAPDLWGMISDPAATVDVGSTSVHFALAAQALRALGHPVDLHFADDQIRIAFVHGAQDHGQPDPAHARPRAT